MLDLRVPEESECLLATQGGEAERVEDLVCSLWANTLPARVSEDGQDSGVPCSEDGSQTPMQPAPLLR